MGLEGLEGVGRLGRLGRGEGGEGRAVRVSEKINLIAPVPVANPSPCELLIFSNNLANSGFT